MEETKEQFGQPADVDALKHHVEVGEFEIKKPSRFRIFFDNVTHAAAHSSRAVDDSYGVFSSIAGVGFTILRVPFIILGVILSIIYFFSNYYKLNKDKEEVSVKSLDDYAQSVITSAHYKTWASKSNKTPEEFEKFVLEHKATEIIGELKKVIARINEQKRQFANYKRQLKNPKLLIKLSSFSRRVELLSKYLQDKLKHNEKKASIDSREDFIKLHNKLYAKLVEGKSLLHYFKLGWFWIVDNYKKLLTGITIAATFGSLSILVWPPLLTFSPWNYIIALGLIVIVATGNYVYKHYYKNKLARFQSKDLKFRNSINDKLLASSLLVDAQVIETKISCAIEDYQKAAENKMLPIKMDENAADKKSSEKSTEEFYEVQQLRNRASRTRYVLMFILPTLLALSAGYNIGATLLQLIVIAGIMPPVLPFIIAGLCFAGIYVIHRLIRSYQEYKNEQIELEITNSNIITEDKIAGNTEVLQIININTLKMHTARVSYRELALQITSDQLLLRIKSVLRRINNLNQSEEVQALKDRLTNLMTNQIDTLKNDELIAKCKKELNITVKNDTQDDQQQSQKSPIKQALYKLFRYALHYLKPTGKGLAFGLSMGASLVIYLIGASSLVTLPASLGILIGGAVFGISVCISNQVLSDFTKVFHDDISQTGDNLADKDRLLDVFVESKQTLWQARQVNRAQLEPNKKDLTGVPSEIKKVIDAQLLADARAKLHSGSGSAKSATDSATGLDDLNGGDTPGVGKVL